MYFHPNICDDGWDAFQRTAEAYRVSDDTFPICPPTPKFWQHGSRGSAVNRWPPLFFDPWIKLIAGGGTLSMDPTPPDAPPVFPNPLTILDNTGTSILPPPADCCYDWQVPTSPLLDVPSSPNTILPSLSQDVDGFEHLTINPPSSSLVEEHFSEELNTTPGSPMPVDEENAGSDIESAEGDREGDNDSYLWSQVSPISAMDMMDI